MVEHVMLLAFFALSVAFLAGFTGNLPTARASVSETQPRRLPKEILDALNVGRPGQSSGRDNLLKNRAAGD